MSAVKLTFRLVATLAIASTVAALPISAMARGDSAGLPQVQASSQGAWKAAHDTDPHSPIINGAHHQGMSPSHQGSLSPLTVPSDFLMGQNQQGQQTGYWCGPATESETVGLLGMSYSQSTEASYLKTDTNGTAWSGVNANVPAQYQTGYPLRDVLDYEFVVDRGWDPNYGVVALQYTPSQTDINNYIGHMTNDISNYWPVIGDAWEVAGYDHLTGHPHNLTIFHIFTINGYNNYGNQTSYEDSATTVWSTVPAYTSGFGTPKLIGILGGRGYIW